MVKFDPLHLQTPYLPFCYPTTRVYGGILSLLCVFVCHFVFCHLVCRFVCTVTDFSAAEKARAVKFCIHVGLLSGQVFYPFGDIGSRRVTRAAA